MPGKNTYSFVPFPLPNEHKARLSYLTKLSSLARLSYLVRLSYLAVGNKYLQIGTISQTHFLLNKMLGYLLMLFFCP